jgi:hypothetical protein
MITELPIETIVLFLRELPNEKEAPPVFAKVTS